MYLRESIEMLRVATNVTVTDLGDPSTVEAMMAGLGFGNLG